MRDIRARHPSFAQALVADAAVTAQFRGERHEFRSPADAALQILRLAWSSDAFLAQAFYRAKARLQALGVPLLPRICHRLAMAIGQVVIDGLTEVGGRARIGPFVTIGLRQGSIHGPRIEDDVQIGTGAKVLGEITVGTGAEVGANAVVIADVAPGTTVAGIPAGPVG